MLAQAQLLRIAFWNDLKLGKQTCGKPASRLQTVDRKLNSVARFSPTLGPAHAHARFLCMTFKNGLKPGEQTHGKPVSRLQARNRKLKSFTRC